MRNSRLLLWIAIRNAFCPTGEGGGVDPTCSPGEAGGGGGGSEGLKKLSKIGLSKGELKKIELVNPGGFAGTVKVPSGLSPDKVAAIQKALPGRTIEKVKTAGLLKGKNAAEMMKAYGVDADAAAYLNASAKGPVKVPLGKGSKEAVEELSKSLPAGTKIQTVSITKDQMAAGKQPAEKASLTSAKTYGELKAGDKYVNSMGKTKEVESIEEKGGQMHVKFKGETGTAVLDKGASLPSSGAPYTPSASSYGQAAAESQAKIAALGIKSSPSLTGELAAAQKHANSTSALQAQEKAAFAKITSSEKADIADYTGSGYHSLNAAMRQCPPHFNCLQGAHKSEAKNIMSAIDKAPPLPNGTIVHRGMSIHDSSLNAAFIANLKEKMDTGGEFQFPSITSTSSVKGKEFSGNYKFAIKAKTGLYTVKHSSVPSEKEVIVSPKTRYKVVDIQHSSGQYNVLLEEIGHG